MTKYEAPILPRLYIYGENTGTFGLYPVYDTAALYRMKYDLSLNRYGNFIRLGPYIDFKSLEGCKTRSVDDFLVACNENDKTVTIYDKTTTKKVRDFDWLNPDAHPQPVVFEPQLRLFAIPKVVKEPKLASKEQSFVDTELFKILQNMGFDSFLSDTSARFFKPLPRIKGKTIKDSALPDSAFLIKTEKDRYTWYNVYSATMSFELIYWYRGKELARYTVKNMSRLITYLQCDRAHRDDYIRQQYSR